MRLRLDQLAKSYAGRTVLDGLSVDFGDARALVLIGPSGGGKSTLLRIVGGLETPTGGTVSLDGEPVNYASEAALRAHRRKLGVVFQAFNLFPHLTALENITLPLLKVHGQSRAAATELAMTTLRRFRLIEHAMKKPAELSGGQKQRVAIARAVAVRPRVLLLDEPTSALDPEMTAEVLDLIAELKAEGRDFVLVTHAMGFARRVADVVALLADGKIAEWGQAGEMFVAPKTDACRSFLEKVLKY